MQVFNPEFVQAVKAELETLKDGFYMTREMLCVAVGVPKEYANAISMITLDPEFSEFEAVKSRGYRRKKVVPI